MQTNFTREQLRTRPSRAPTPFSGAAFIAAVHRHLPDLRAARRRARRPRGRIYLIKEMFEQGARSTPPIDLHIDRCLSCLSCMTTCPSGVDYMHLVDLARVRIEHEGTLAGRAHDALAARQGAAQPVDAFALALLFGWLARPFRGLIAKLGMKTGAAALALAPNRPAAFQAPQAQNGDSAPSSRRSKRVALLLGCVQQVLRLPSPAPPSGCSGGTASTW